MNHMLPITKLVLTGAIAALLTLGSTAHAAECRPHHRDFSSSHRCYWHHHRHHHHHHHHHHHYSR